MYHIDFCIRYFFNLSRDPSLIFKPYHHSMIIDVFCRYPLISCAVTPHPTHLEGSISVVLIPNVNYLFSLVHWLCQTRVVSIQSASDWLHFLFWIVYRIYQGVWVAVFDWSRAWWQRSRYVLLESVGVYQIRHPTIGCSC